jgi:adenosylcobinamide-phosphate synthase
MMLTSGSGILFGERGPIGGGDRVWLGKILPVWTGYDLAAWILLAAVVDLMIGDPLWSYHPVRLIGKFGMFLEQLIRRRPWGRTAMRFLGAVMTLSVVLLVLAFVTAVLWFARDLSVWLFRAMVVLWTYWGLAIRGLTDAALLVYRPLVTNQSDEARQWLQYIVSRDTARFSPEEMIRATIETVAGNTCDAVIGPLFYTFLGGPAWLWAYKAVNTLDSMVGQHSGRHQDLGWFAAHLDEWANYVPARLSGWAIAIAASMEGRFRPAYRAMRQDARRHPSPNTGMSEAAMAGAIGVALGGPNLHDDVVSLRPRLGASERPLHPTAIIHAIAVSWRATLVAAVVFGVVAVTVSGVWL